MSRPGLEALKDAARPGCCVICGDALPPARGFKPRSVLCGEPECRAAYFRAYAYDRDRATARREAQG